MQKALVRNVAEIVRLALSFEDIFGLPRVSAQAVELFIHGKGDFAPLLPRVHVLFENDRTLSASVPFDLIERAVREEAAHLREHGRHRSGAEIAAAYELPQTPLDGAGAA